MARVVTIEVTGESGQYTAMVNKIQSDNAKLYGSAQQGAAQTAQNIQTVTGALGRWDSTLGKVAVSSRNVGQAVNIVASQVAGLGQVANLASNAIVTMTTVSGPAGIALAALAATIGLLVYRIEQARERLRELNEIEIAAIGREKRGLEFEQDIKRRIAILRSAQPEIEAVRQEFDKLRLAAEKGEARPQAIRDIEIAKALEIQKIRTEQAKKEKEAQDQLRKSLEDQADALNAQLIQMELGQEAADQFKINNLLASEAVKKLGAEGIDTVRAIESLLAAFRRFNEEKERSAAVTKFLLESETAENAVKEQNRQQIEKEFALKEQLLEVDIEILRAKGLTTEADRAQLQGLIRLNEERKKALEAADIVRQPGELALIDRQITLQQTKIQQLGIATVNIGQQISSTIADMFTGVIQGTLKLADIGKSLLGGVARTAGDFLSQILNKKLGFENLMLTNMQQLPSQMNNAYAAGIQQLGPGTTFTTAGPGQGFSNILSSGVQPGGSIPGLSSLFTTSFNPGGFFPGGLSLGGILGGAGVGFGLGGIARAFGAPPQAQLGSTIGGTLGSIVGATSIGGSILGALGGTAIGGAVSSAVTGALGASIAGMLGAMVVPFIGAIIGLIIGMILGNQKPNPTAVLGAQFSGVNFNAATGQFDPGQITVTLRKVSEMSKSKAISIANEVQGIMSDLTVQWVDLLNMFPEVVKKEMIPALDSTNQILNQSFQRLKFSEGGSRSIREELNALRGPTGAQGKFIEAFFGPYQAGLLANVARAGLNVSGFPLASGIWPDRSFGAGPGATQAQIDELVKTMQGMIEFTNQLGDLGDVRRFLTTADIEGVQSQIGQLLGIRDSEQLAKALEQVKKNLQPVLDFVSSAMEQAADVFGRGLIAAMEAATESDAQAAFMNSLGTGIKDVVFQGITEAFIASAQFEDLLAPIQQTIREFTQQAFLTGQAPDIAAFRAAILPNIETILGRAELLGDLIAALQDLGFTIKDRLGLNPPPETPAEPPPPPQQNYFNITVNTPNAQQFMTDLERLLSTGLPPTN